MKTLLKKSLLALTLLTILLCLFGTVKVKDESTPRYSGYGDIVPYSSSTVTETITYTKREISYVETYKSVPKYTQLSEFPNSCGPTGGAIIVGFYDRYYEELIPNYVSYVSSGTYKGNDGVYVPQLMSELYTLMRTNVDDVGVSQADCLNGLSAYVKNRGRSITYSSIANSKKINENSYISAINNNNPTLLFCTKMDMYNFSANSTQETVICTTYDGAHIAVAYGLYTVNYYNGSSIFRTEKYLRVATGLDFITTGYLKISTTDWCNAAYAVIIN